MIGSRAGQAYPARDRENHGQKENAQYQDEIEESREEDCQAD